MFFVGSGGDVVVVVADYFFVCFSEISMFQFVYLTNFSSTLENGSQTCQAQDFSVRLSFLTDEDLYSQCC